MAVPFRDRSDAGRLLAESLVVYADRPDVVVLGLPRGGIPVAYQVAKRLNAPLDAFLVRKLGVPGHDELAMGAIAAGGIRVLNQEVIDDRQIDASVIDEVAAREQRELERREQVLRGGRGALDVRGLIVVLVDDGLATGSTMRAAAVALRQLSPARVVGAVPVAAPDVCLAMRDVVDEMHCLETPDPFHAVGLWYDDFAPPSEREVRRLLGAK